MMPHLDAAYTLARYLLRSEDAAQDAVQEAFLRAVRHFDGYRGGSARAWLLTIVRHCCVTARKRGRREDSFLANDREVLILREAGNLSYEEIGLTIGAPISTVMSRLARARKRMALVHRGSRDAS